MPRDSISWRKEINFPLHSGTGTTLKSPALQAEPIERGTTTGKACKFTTSRPEAPAPALSAGWARETHQPTTVGHPIPCNSLFRWKIYSNSSYCKGLPSWLVLRGKRGDKNQARLSRLYPISIWLIAIIGYRLSGGWYGRDAREPTHPPDKLQRDGAFLFRVIFATTVSVFGLYMQHIPTDKHTHVENNSHHTLSIFTFPWFKMQCEQAPSCVGVSECVFHCDAIWLWKWACNWMGLDLSSLWSRKNSSITLP